MTLFLETTIDFLKGTAVSGITSNALDKRYEFDSKIDLAQAAYYKKQDFLELIFFANSTYGNTSFVAATDVPQGKNGQYTLCLRFYKVEQYLQNEEHMSYTQLEDALKKAVHNCDVKMYSDDPSWFYQGGWESCDEEGLSIYKFPGPKGTGEWQGRHQASGGLTGKAHITKHLAQVINFIDSYVRDISKNLVIMD